MHINVCLIWRGRILRPHLHPYAPSVCRLRADIEAGGRHSLSIHGEVVVGKKKTIRWAERGIIEVMIGAVQRQLIVMETGGAAGRALGGLGEFQTRMWNKRHCCSSERGIKRRPLFTAVLSENLCNIVRKRHNRRTYYLTRKRNVNQNRLVNVSLF